MLDTRSVLGRRATGWPLMKTAPISERAWAAGKKGFRRAGTATGRPAPGQIGNDADTLAVIERGQGSLQAASPRRRPDALLCAQPPDRGGMRRQLYELVGWTWLRGRENVHKRYLLRPCAVCRRPQTESPDAPLIARRHPAKASTAVAGHRIWLNLRAYCASGAFGRSDGPHRLGTQARRNRLRRGWRPAKRGSPSSETAPGQ